ncbi:MAG: hypothetical protein ACI8TP_002681 [Acidimicrobiales bacterium]|jgi:hypothetical protein
MAIPEITTNEPKLIRAVRRLHQGVYTRVPLGALFDRRSCNDAHADFARGASAGAVIFDLPGTLFGWGRLVPMDTQR